TTVLIVTRSIDRNLKHTGRDIALAEWGELVESDPDLRLRTDPYLGVDPHTGQKLLIKVNQAQSEFAIGGEWWPFLHFRDGALRMMYSHELRDPENPIRAKLAAIAAQLDAVITYDAGGEILDW